MTSLHSLLHTSSSTSKGRSSHPFQWVAEELFFTPGLTTAQVQRLRVCILDASYILFYAWFLHSNFQKTKTSSLLLDVMTLLSCNVPFLPFGNTIVKYIRYIFFQNP